MLRILYLEDNKMDAHLIQHVIKKDGLQAEFLLVSSREKFKEAVGKFSFDLILADYSLPDFNALDAIHHVRSAGIDIPILLVSGAISSESAVEVVKAGATDYILKDHLVRLVPAIDRALEEYLQQKKLKEHEKEIQKKNTILSQAEYLGKMGAFEWDLISNTITWTPGLYMIFEVNPGEFEPSIEKISHFIHSDDLEQLSRKIMPGKERLKPGRSQYQEVFRLMLAENKVKYVNSTGEVIFDEYRTPLRVVGVMQDITEQKLAEASIRQLNDELEKKVLQRTKELAKSEKKYRLISDNITDLITVHKEHSHFTYVSKSVEDLLGYLPEELLGIRPKEIIHEEDYPLFLAGFSKAVLSETRQILVEARVKKKNGEFVWMESKLRIQRNKKDSLHQIQSSSRDISHRKLAEEQQRQALIKERELNELQAQFVSIASHQFRTPLAIIRSNVELLDIQMQKAFPAGENGKPREVLSRINGEIDHLTGLMDDILEMGKVEAGKVSPHFEEVNMTDFLNSLLYSQKDSNGQEALPSLQIMGDPCTVMVDRRLLSHAIFNLISNAYKYSDEGSIPEMELEYATDEVIIRIIDHGIGIPEEEKKYLFQSWFRASNTQMLRGTGLGLAISKKFVEANRGSISFESELNKGSTFEVKFPIHQKSNTYGKYQ